MWRPFGQFVHGYLGLWILFFVCAGAARAGNSSASMSWGDGSANCTVTVNEETGAYTFSYSVVHRDNAYGQSAYLGYIYDSGGYITPHGANTITESRTYTGVFTNGPGIVRVVAHGWDSATPSDLHSDQKDFHIGGKLTCQPGNRTTTGGLNSAIIGTATGSKNGAAYNLSILSGPGVAAMNSANGEWTIIPTGVGSIQAKFWISGAGIWLRSDDVVVYFTVQPEPEKKNVTVTLPGNGGTAPITYDVMQDGKSIGSFTQQGGAGAKIFQVGVNVGGGPVTMMQTTQGVKQDGASVVQTGDGSGSISKPNHLVDNPSDLTDGQTFVVDTDGKITDSNTGKVVDQTTPTKTPDKNTSPIIWDAGGGSQTDLVTNTVYREGVGKTVQAVSDLSDKLFKTDEKPDGLPVLTTFDDVKAHPTKSEVVDAVQALMPKAPTFPTSIGRQADMDVELGDMGGIFSRSISIKIGLPANARTVAEWLRNIELFGLYVVFFFMVVKLIRSTFA